MQDANIMLFSVTPLNCFHDLMDIQWKSILNVTCNEVLQVFLPAFLRLHTVWKYGIFLLHPISQLWRVNLFSHIYEYLHSTSWEISVI